ncbi:hypothetical protein L6452_30360 [Arctium lappa]|uniref:Uncharacterized protein n=1 Tax=Arctium lappa TaxID=4217 RepID=A0ACB8ZJ84_ARCLA|nr:hypothetical protein L6452_30360 [Arctium lappa]
MVIIIATLIHHGRYQVKLARLDCLLRIQQLWPLRFNQNGEKRLLAFTRRGTNILSDFSYKRGDRHVFGSEATAFHPKSQSFA